MKKSITDRLGYVIRNSELYMQIASGQIEKTDLIGKFVIEDFRISFLSRDEDSDEVWNNSEDYISFAKEVFKEAEKIYSYVRNYSNLIYCAFIKKYAIERRKFSYFFEETEKEWQEKMSAKFGIENDPITVRMFMFEYNLYREFEDLILSIEERKKCAKYLNVFAKNGGIEGKNGVVSQEVCKTIADLFLDDMNDYTKMWHIVNKFDIQTRNDIIDFFVNMNIIEGNYLYRYK